MPMTGNGMKQADLRIPCRCRDRGGKRRQRQWRPGSTAPATMANILWPGPAWPHFLRSIYLLSIKYLVRARAPE